MHCILSTIIWTPAKGYMTFLVAFSEVFRPFPYGITVGEGGGWVGGRDGPSESDPLKTTKTAVI